MALQSRTFTVGEVGNNAYNRYALELTLTEESVDHAQNTSLVSYVLRLCSGTKNFSGYGLGAQIKLAGTVVASRDRLTEPRMSIGQNDTLHILSGSATIAHQADGSLDMPVEFWIETATSSYTPGYMAMTDGSMTLTVIPRKSTIRATNADIGKASVLAITRQSTAYTHSVRYVFGNQQGYVSSRGTAVSQEEIFSDTSVEFVLPESFYNEIPNDQLGVGSFVVTTYAGDTAIGWDQVGFTAYTDADLCAPVISAFSARDINPLTLEITRDDQTYIQHCSTVSCQVTASGQKGATVQSVRINGNSKLEFPAETDRLELVVTDSRGYVTQQSLGLSMIPYGKLTCHASAKRTTPTGSQVLVQVEGQHDDSRFHNQMEVMCSLPDGRLVYIPYTKTGIQYRGELLLEDISYQADYTFEVMARDQLMDYHEQVTIINVQPVFDWGNSDFTFHVPVNPQKGINGVYMKSFSGNAMKIYIDRRPQTFLIAAGSVLGVVNVHNDGIDWVGSAGVTADGPWGYDYVDVEFPTTVSGIILSNRKFRE